MPGKPLITLTSDFGVQSQGIGIMESVAYEINPEARVIHLMHGLPDFNLYYAAHVLETVNCIPIGYHVCVVDPGVGTERRAIAIKTGRGDYLIGPNNGVLMPATRFLGGIKKVVEITNPKYMRQPVSPIFHGRDIFTPAAAYLSKGVKMEELGIEIYEEELAKGPYEEALVEKDQIHAKVISINKFGSLHLNIRGSAWNEFGVGLNDVAIAYFKDESMELPFATTFGNVEKGEALIMKDEYGRMEVSLNHDSFAKAYGISIGDDFVIEKK